MKAHQITGGPEIRPLPLLSAYRKGDVDAELYRKQAAGEAERVVPDLRVARFVRTIALDDGKFTGLADDQSGSLLTFVISGEVTLASGGGTATLVPGDLFLVDEANASRVDVKVRGDCRLVQVGVEPDWPGPGATIQNPGAQTPRDNGEITIKRVYKGDGDDDLAYYRDFPELFAGPRNQWSESRPGAGMRFMSWEDGFLDWHPEVVNNFAMILAGEIELQTSGDRVTHFYHAGDICLATDKTGVGHVDCCRGYTHVALVVMDDEHLW